MASCIKDFSIHVNQDAFEGINPAFEKAFSEHLNQ